MDTLSKYIVKLSWKLLNYKGKHPEPASEEHGSPSANQSVQQSLGSDQSISLHHFIRITQIGTGTFAAVQLVRSIKNGQVYALKIVPKIKAVMKGQVQHLLQERDIMGRVDHPFCVTLYRSWQDEFCLYFLVEYAMGGEFYSHLREALFFTEEVARFYAASVVLVFEKMHSMNFIYRDLKPENLLLDHQGYLKVCDFGFSKVLTNGEKAWTQCGTAEYLAPEVLQSTGQTFSLDWWCLGVFIFEMLAGNTPFAGKDVKETCVNILYGELDFSATDMSPSARKLISGLLTRESAKRLGSGRPLEVHEQIWFKALNFDALLSRSIDAPLFSKMPHFTSDEDTIMYDDTESATDPGPSGFGVLVSDEDQKRFEGF